MFIFRSVSPFSGPIAGGTTIVITGIDLGGSQSEVAVSIGDLDCNVVEYTTGTSFDYQLSTFTKGYSMYVLAIPSELL